MDNSVDRLFSVFKTASRGMSVQRRQLMVSSENIANANTTRVEGREGPYRPKMLRTSVGEGSKDFRAKFDKSRLTLRLTRNEHMEKNNAMNLSGQQPENLGPEDEVVEVEQYRYEYDPAHPDADENGMVKYPDLDMVEEMTKMVSANRLYEANLAVVEAEKQVIRQALQL